MPQNEMASLKPVPSPELVKAAERFTSAVQFLRRDDISTLSPLEKYVLGAAIGLLFLYGRISYVGLYGQSVTAIQHGGQISDDDNLDDVKKAMKTLENKGFLKYDAESQSYSFQV